MAKRSKINYSQSKKHFRKSSGVHPKNTTRPNPVVMRGGIRL